MSKKPLITDVIANILYVKKVHCIKDNKGNTCDTVFDYPKGFPFSYVCPKCNSNLGIEFLPSDGTYIALTEGEGVATLLAK